MNKLLALFRSDLDSEKVVLLLEEVALLGIGAWQENRMSSLRTFSRSRCLSH
jgi:hypothetical protein